MNIAIDMMEILENKNVDGDSISLLKTLLQLDKQNKYFLLNLYDDVSLKDLLQYGDNTSEYYFNTGKDSFLWRYPELIGEIYRNFILEHNIDLFFLAPLDNHNYPVDKSWFNNTNLDTLHNIFTKRDETISSEEAARLVLESISYITPPPKQAQKRSNINKIAFFTPLPPIKSGISDYSVDIICELSKYFSIDVFIDTGYKHNCLLPQNVNVYKHTQFYKNDKKYYKLVFQIGNNIYHEYMLKYINKYNGVVVLHDCNLHGLLNSITYDRKKYKDYIKLLSYDYKDEVMDVINAIQSGKQQSDFIVNCFVTKFADIIIVHSKWGKKQLLLKNIEANIEHINLYAQIPNYSFEESDMIKQSAKKKLQINDKDIVIASFGFLTENKRCIPSLHAIRRIIKEFPQTKMIYVGQINNKIKDDFFCYIKQNNLQDSVSLTGFTSLETFLLYIEATDICLNLRFPYHGETSATLSRIMAAGKCVIINDIGSFSEIPDDCCVKLPSPENMSLENEEELIYNTLKDLFNNSKKCNGIGMAARKYAEKELDINKIGRQYINVLLRQPRQRALTNEILSDIKMKINNTDNENIFNLSKTLAYTMQDQDTIF